MINKLDRFFKAISTARPLLLIRSFESEGRFPVSRKVNIHVNSITLFLCQRSVKPFKLSNFNALLLLKCTGPELNS